ncbi:MAG: glycosyltransferase [Spartobacteria bacterium]|nr:glycosyltransferase [Spartobacteria bacterium]
MKKKTAAVLNDHLHVLGGGERSSLAYARALVDLGYETRLLTSLAVPSRETITSVFGPEFADIPMEFIPWEGRAETMKHMGLDLFINHSMMAFDPNPARLGFYLQMFPAVPLTDQERPEDVARLATYQHMICISSFTRRHTRERWTYPAAQQSILAPPIGKKALAIARRARWLPQTKEKRIISVGRFNPRLQNKNQLILIRAFLDARAGRGALGNWQLVLVGNVNPDPESSAYHQACLDAAQDSGGAVQIRSNMDGDELFGLLASSFGYAHGAGAFVDEGAEPERCEHYGIAIGEAMACGCIPLLYQYGGYWDFIERDSGGLAYADHDSLADGYRRIAALYNSRQARTMRRQNRRAAFQLSQRHFTCQLAELLKNEMRDTI